MVHLHPEPQQLPHLKTFISGIIQYCVKGPVIIYGRGGDFFFPKFLKLKAPLKRAEI
jgi:hypothetical protein